MFGDATRFPVISPEANDMGPLEEVDFGYRTIKWQYGETQNTKGWNTKERKEAT